MSLADKNTPNTEGLLSNTREKLGLDEFKKRRNANFNEDTSNEQTEKKNNPFSIVLDEVLPEETKNSSTPIQPAQENIMDAFNALNEECIQDEMPESNIEESIPNEDEAEEELQSSALELKNRIKDSLGVNPHQENDIDLDINKEEENQNEDEYLDSAINDIDQIELPVDEPNTIDEDENIDCEPNLNNEKPEKKSELQSILLNYTNEKQGFNCVTAKRENDQDELEKAWQRIQKNEDWLNNVNYNMLKSVDLTKIINIAKLRKAADIFFDTLLGELKQDENWELTDKTLRHRYNLCEINFGVNYSDLHITINKDVVSHNIYTILHKKTHVFSNQQYEIMFVHIVKLIEKLAVADEE